MKQEPMISVRVQKDLLQKLRYCAEGEGRSLNSLLLFLIRRYIGEYEAIHGQIWI